jgi:hypothetical protein
MLSEPAEDTTIKYVGQVSKFPPAGVKYTTKELQDFFSPAENMPDALDCQLDFIQNEVTRIEMLPENKSSDTDNAFIDTIEKMLTER